MNQNQQDILAALRALQRDAENPLPSREADPVSYVIEASNRAERSGEELSPADKELAYKLFIAGAFSGPISASADDDE
jgi:hypothetical protein